MRAGLALALVASLAIIAPMPAAAGAPPDTGPSIFSLSIQLDAPSQAARVTDTAPGIVQFTGHVSVDKLPVQSVSVTLASSVDTGWVSLVSPASMVFTSTATLSFIATTVAPQKTLSTVIGNMLIRASSSGTGADAEATAYGTITVDQYYKFNLTSDAPSFETDKSEISTEFKLLVTNLGNGPDTFALEIGNMEELRSKGWTARLDREVTPVVQPGVYVEVVVTVASPEFKPGFELKTQDVKVNATSVGARAQNTTLAQSIMLHVQRSPVDPVFDLTVPIIIVAVVVASVAVVALRWRKRRKRAIEADAGNASSDEAIVVEAD